MYYLLKDNDNAVCMPNTNDNCGESGITCKNDTYCMDGVCKSNCDDGYELCQGIGCVIIVDSINETTVMKHIRLLL